MTTVPTLSEEYAFLLTLNFSNLFEPKSAAPGIGELYFRCKGCKDIIERWNREDHFQAHIEAQKSVISVVPTDENGAPKFNVNSDGLREVICEVCNNPFLIERKRGRPRKACTVCRP